MARAIWSGTVAFGLVAVPVKLLAAVRPKEVRFHQLHDADGARIREQRICSAEGKEVPYEHVVKGYEVSRGQYVMIDPEELAALDPKASRTIEIEDFVEASEIDPIYYDHSYYLVPDRGGQKAYALLVQAMAQHGKVAIAKVVLRAKQSLCALRASGPALVLSTMRWADEVVPARDLEGLPQGAAPRPNELRMAEQLIDTLVTDFEPARYHDEYRERVLELIERKRAGEELVAPAEAPPRRKAVDLMEALKASLESGKAPPEPGGERTRRAPPRRESARKPARRRAHARGHGHGNS